VNDPLPAAARAPRPPMRRRWALTALRSATGWPRAAAGVRPMLVGYLAALLAMLWVGGCDRGAAGADAAAALRSRATIRVEAAAMADAEAPPLQAQRRSGSSASA